MKILLSLALSLFIATITFSQDIKDITWGMNQQEVINMETSEFYDSVCPVQDYCLLYYNDTFFGDSAFIAYEFYSDHLRLYTYFISSDVTYAKEYTFILKYLNILKSKYNEPDQITWNWKKQSFKSRFNESPENVDTLFNFYFATGDLINVSYQWRLPDLVIQLTTFVNVQNDGKKWPTIMIKYSSY